MNSLKAAASPARRLNNYNRAASDSPKTPRSHAARSNENVEDGGLSIIAASAMTPMKRVPILADFEEWMKMATDNKINAANSWNFALIDYFHDMSLLKEGDGVNFQKASCTLDGCVKIYTSRVDSVATETGKLLSGLADSGNKKTKRGEEEGEDGEGEKEEEGEDGTKTKKRKRVSYGSKICYGNVVIIFADATDFGSYLSTFVCFATTKEIRARILCGPSLQKGSCRL
jgi:condensin complex subunit 2